MNHGYCINCWWYKVIKGRHYILTKNGLKEKLGNGKCFMHVGDVDDFSLVDGDSYCPDYYNRKRGNKEQKKTLDEWLNS
jgi:hypothetical protein